MAKLIYLAKSETEISDLKEQQPSQTNKEYRNYLLGELNKTRKRTEQIQAENKMLMAKLGIEFSFMSVKR